MFILPQTNLQYLVHIHLVIEKKSKQLFERSVHNLSQKVTVKARAGIQKSEM